MLQARRTTGGSAGATRGLSLRWRLVLSFQLVSVVPVILASYIAASTIEAAFRRNVETWLGETARFLSGETGEARDDADKAATIMAAALEERGRAQGSASEAARPFGDLLISTGYDLVQVFDRTGKTEFSVGAAELHLPPPLQNMSSILMGRIHGKDTLLVGAVRSFQIGGAPHYVFVANLIDSNLFGMSHALSSIRVRVFRLVGRDPADVVDTPEPHQHNQIARTVVEALGKGAPSLVYAGDRRGSLTAFAPLRGTGGQLMGAVACQLTGASDVFERLGRWTLFLGLAALAGLLSFVAALAIASRIAEPVKSLTRGVRDVADGHYETRVPEEGGREIAELAGGFNMMVDRLQRLNSMEAEMRRKEQLASLGEAAAVIAHEIRNPLGIIRTSSEVVRLRTRLGPEEDRLLGFVLDEVARIDRLVSDVLDYVRPRQIRAERIDLHAIVARAQEGLALAAAGKGITITVRPTDGPLLIDGDADQIHQALLNLVLNAIDAMPNGGEVVIEEIREPAQCLLAIGDTGEGIAPEDIGRIFDPFFTTKLRGTGLGLAKVQSILADHEGSIEVRSSPRGTIFTLKFRAAIPMEGSHAA